MRMHSASFNCHKKMFTQINKNKQDKVHNCDVVLISLSYWQTTHYVSQAITDFVLLPCQQRSVQFYEAVVQATTYINNITQSYQLGFV